MSFKPLRLDPKKTYLLQFKGRVEFVAQLTPMKDSPHLGNARRFDGKWLNDETCWRWWTFHEPIEVEEAFKLYGKPELKRVVRDRLLTKAEVASDKKARAQIAAEFPPKKKPKPEPKKKAHARHKRR